MSLSNTWGKLRGGMCFADRALLEQTGGGRAIPPFRYVGRLPMSPPRLYRALNTLHCVSQACNCLSWRYMRHRVATERGPAG
eukprot:scaffold425867_cov20-Prasinocladus_malaysianus.AAC.1